MGILPTAFSYGSLWTMNPFDVLYCLSDHFILIPSIGFRLVILLIVILLTVDYTREVTDCELEISFPYSRDLHK
jgi:hypothetical protein